MDLVRKLDAGSGAVSDSTSDGGWVCGSDDMLGVSWGVGSDAVWDAV